MSRARAPRRPRALGALAFLAFSAVALLALSWGSWPLSHDDLFWHLRAGERIAAEKSVPPTDFLSYTRAGSRWVTHEWGFSLVTYGLHQLGGFRALLAAKALTVLLLFAVIAAAGAAAARAARGDPGRYGAPMPVWLPALLAALVGLALWAAQAELIFRAALVGSVLLALLVVLLERFRSTGDRRLLAGAAALFLPWANLHSGVIFGLLVFACYATEAVVGARWRHPPAALAGLFRTGPPAPWLIALAAAAVLTLANPNGVEAPLYPFRLAHTLFWSGLDLELGHFRAAVPTRQPAVALLLAALLAGLLPPGRRRAPPLALLLATAAFLALAFRTSRFAVELAVVAVPAAAAAWAGGRRGAVRVGADEGGPSRAAGRLLLLRPAALLALATTLAAGAATAAHWRARERLPDPLATLSPQLPAAAVDFLAAEGIRGHVFNHQNLGGYLGWRLGEPIFWDGRNDVFAPLIREMETVPFPTVVERYGVDHLLITAHEYASMAPLLVPGGEWGPVFWDDQTVVYLRRGPRFAAQLARLEYRIVPPFGSRFDVRRAAADPAWAAAARGELERAQAADPRSQRALYFAGLLSTAEGDLPRAAGELARARELGPHVEVYLASALVLERLGRGDEAAALRHRAAALAAADDEPGDSR